MYHLIENNTNFIVVYKNPGVSFHCEANTLGLFEYVKQQEKLSELYPVHRLDKVTSGLLVMAKTAAANQELVNQFAERRIEKYYLAVSDKKPKKKQGLVKGDMASSRRGAYKLLTTQLNPAISQFFSVAMGTGRRLFLIKPRTGKTHQIRVALKSLGSPILGDSLYGDAIASLAVDRTYLHAYELAFSLAGCEHRFQVLPQQGEHFLSPEFTTAVAAFQNPREHAWPSV
jgi:tRNA pseudouridine32 synthase/23S rRNA pseudouridine746 synthase